MTAYDDPTPRLDDHARDRCREMGISTKVAKQVVRHAQVTYCGDRRKYGPDNRIAISPLYPDYAVVYDEPRVGDRPVIRTVLFNAEDFGERAGPTYVPKETP